MGRMLDALKQPHGNRSRPAEAAPAPSLAPAAEDVEPLDDADGVPFIEVGGPRPAAGAKAPLPLPMPAVAESATGRGTELRMPAAPSPAPWAVEFRPWGQSPSGGPQPAAEVVAFHQPEHAVSLQYRTLLNGLLLHLPPTRGKVLLFTSPAPWTGTTTVLLNLAVTAARQLGRRVAVVDANLRRPALAERLGLAPTPGLCDVLAGSVLLARAVQDTAQANLSALAAGRVGSGDVRLPLDWLLPTLRQFREQFDLVFVDAPSWNEGSEVSALAATCDAVYMVLHHKDAAPGAIPGMRQPPRNLQGCILTLR